MYILNCYDDKMKTKDMENQGFSDVKPKVSQIYAIYGHHTRKELIKMVNDLLETENPAFHNTRIRDLIIIYHYTKKLMEKNVK